LRGNKEPYMEGEELFSPSSFLPSFPLGFLQPIFLHGGTGTLELEEDFLHKSSLSRALCAPVRTGSK